MPLLMLKQLPRYDCLMQAAERYPTLDPQAFEAFLHLLYTSDTIFHQVDSFLNGRGITQGRFTVLNLLSRRPDHVGSPAELADDAGVTRATMSGLLDTAEKEGLVAREHDHQDRRGVIVRMTAHGESVLESILPAYCQCVSARLSALSADEQRLLVALMQKLLRDPGQPAEEN